MLVLHVLEYGPFLAADLAAEGVEAEVLDLRDVVKIMVGGAPVTDGFAKQIGADGYAPDASRAATLAKSLCKV